MNVIFSPVLKSIEHIKAGKLRPLAVTTAKRLDGLPGVPTGADFVPGYEATALPASARRKITPADIIDLLNRELNADLAKIKTRIVELGGTVLGGSPAEFGTIPTDSIDKWTRVTKLADIKVE